MIPRITVRESHDAEVIRGALAVYLEDRKVKYHRAAATADTEQTLKLSLDYESDKEYVCGLLRAVGDGTMTPQPDEPDTDSEEGSNNE